MSLNEDGMGWMGGVSDMRDEAHSVTHACLSIATHSPAALPRNDVANIG